MCRIVALVLLVAIVVACRRPRDEVVVYTSVDQAFSEPVFQQFERSSGIAVRAVYDTEETKSTGVLSRLLAEASNPRADVFWSGDPIRPFSLIDRGLVEPYRATTAGAIPEAFKSPDGTWAGTAARARVLVVNTTRVAPAEMPTSIRDLAAPRFRDRAAIANPLFGTTTMHVAALFVAWGDDEAMRFLESLKDNGVRIAASNGEVKRLVTTGEVALGLTDTDDADEATKEGAPVKVIYPDQDGLGTLVMPTTTVMIKGGPHPSSARKLVDYLVSADAEKQLAISAAHIPLRTDVAAPGVRRVADFRVMKCDYARVATEMERIAPRLRAWVGL